MLQRLRNPRVVRARSRLRGPHARSTLFHHHEDEAGHGGSDTANARAKAMPIAV
jgi:hypothetical protein